MPFIWAQLKCQTVVFHPEIGLYQLLTLRARVDLGAMAMKGSPHSLKLLHYWNLTIRFFSVITWTLVKWQSVYSIALADWAVMNNVSRHPAQGKT